MTVKSKRAKSSQNGFKTQSASRRAALFVANKDPDFDYSFRRKKDIEEGGGVDRYGYEPVDAENSNGEKWDGPRSFSSKSKGKGNLVNQDTILCKRPLEAKSYFEQMENEKYNSQMRLVMDAGKIAQAKLRSLGDDGATVVDQSTGLEKSFTQRKGPTEATV